MGAARCEQSCYNEAQAHRAVLNTFLDDIHRPSLPYKFKFKFSGCANDCMNAIQRADMAVIGTWRDNIRTDEALAKKWFAKHGMDELVNDVVARCPTKTFQLKEILPNPFRDLEKYPLVESVVEELMESISNILDDRQMENQTAESKSSTTNDRQEAKQNLAKQLLGRIRSFFQ